MAAIARFATSWHLNIRDSLKFDGGHMALVSSPDVPMTWQMILDPAVYPSELQVAWMLLRRTLQSSIAKFI